MLDRLSSGWDLVRASARVIAEDRSLAVFPLLSLVCSLVAFAVFANEVLWLIAVHGPLLLTIPFALLGLYVLVFVTVFFNVALAAAASESLDGEDSSLSDGLDVAWCRLATIARWSLVALAVGSVLSLLEHRRGLAHLLGEAAELAWSTVTFFVVPVIALEDVDAGRARRRSLEIVKRCWAEELAGRGALKLIAAVPAAFVALLGSLVFHGGITFTPASELFLAFAGVVTLATTLAVSTVSQVFAVALYREHASLAAAA